MSESSSASWVDRPEAVDRNLGMELVRVTEAAALSAAPFMGRGDGKAGDAAAVRAMRAVLRTVRMRGRVVIGEGEKDDAPMLFNGEEVGTGEAPELDLAVDPVEGTRLLALGRPNAIAVVAAAPAGGMWDPAGSFYAEKLVVERAAAGAVDLRLTPTENLHRAAEALGRPVERLTVFVLEKPRHEALVREIREAGARVTLHTDGDVMGAILAAYPDTGVDLLMGTGGTPEAVLAAAAVKALGGGMQAVAILSRTWRWRVSGQTTTTVAPSSRRCSAWTTWSRRTTPSSPRLPSRAAPSSRAFDTSAGWGSPPSLS
jgi:fructose-1,6-bisphosphatase II